MDNNNDKKIPKAKRKPKPYKVGFGKPPLDTRFQKGQSGNPSGRPKGKRNIATILNSTLNEMVVITENGERKKITKLEASIKQLVNKATVGDLPSLKTVLQVSFLIEQLTETNEVKSSTSEIDNLVLIHFKKQLKATEGEDK